MRVKIFWDDTALPRIEAGTISERYRGEIAIAQPVTKVFQKRPMTNEARFGAKS